MSCLRIASRAARAQDSFRFRVSYDLSLGADTAPLFLFLAGAWSIAPNVMRRLDPNTIKYTNCTCWTVGRRRTEIKQRRFDSYKKETEHYVPSLLSLFRKIMIGFTPKEQRRVRYYGKIPPKRVHNICKGWQPNEPTMIVFRFQHDLHSPRYPSLPAFETIPGLCANL